MEIKERMNKILSYMTKGVYEKEHIMALALLCAIAGESIFLLGPPGTAKSLVARRLKMIFKEGKAFEYLMSRFSTPDEIFGPVSILKLKNEDIYERKVDGFLPSATVVFLDEIWKAGPAIQNTLLTAINEHIFQNGSDTIKLPMKALIAASNELPAEDEGLEALWDRFLVRIVSNCIEDEDAFFKMAMQKTNAQVLSIPESLLITDNELKLWDEQIDEIEVPEYVCRMISDIRKRLKEEGLKEGVKAFDYYISDRRWKKIFHLLKTSAFLNGRKSADYSDCMLLFHCLWNKDTCIPQILRIVCDSFISGMMSKIASIQNQIDLYIRERVNTHAKREPENDIEIVDYFYFKLANYPKGNCLLPTNEYKHVFGEKSIPGYIYFDNTKKSYIIRSLGKEDKTSFRLKEDKNIARVLIAKISGGITINRVPYLFSRLSAQDQQAQEELFPMAETSILNRLQSELQKEIWPQVECLSQSLKENWNLFNSNKDKALVYNMRNILERRIKELEVKIQNTAMIK